MAPTSVTLALRPTARGARREPRPRVRGYEALPRRGLRWWLRLAFFALIARPVLFVLMGLNVHHRARLPKSGPALIVANHNSHFDTMALLTLFPLAELRRLRPVAAADYFDDGSFVGWFVKNIIGVVFVARNARSGTKDVLAPVVEALRAGDMVIFFPEGTRGEPEKMGPFKRGLGWVVEHCPDVPVVPVRLDNVGRILPRGAKVPLPLMCDVTIGEPMVNSGDPRAFVDSVRDTIVRLSRARDARTTQAEVTS